MIIDSHAHVILPAVSQALASLDALTGGLTARVRAGIRLAASPLVQSLHKAQVNLRLTPRWMQGATEVLATPTLLGTLLVEGVADDLLRSMGENRVDRTLVLAHPPLLPNESVLDLADAFPDQISAVVNLPPGTPHAGERLRNFVSRGARALKIHAAADGEDARSLRYLLLIETAADLDLPVILHTGCIHGPMYRNPELGDPRRFEAWFREHPKTTFILAHTGLHDPESALEMASRYANVCVETSWQPAEVIGESARRLGAERVLYGSDWPFLGQNQRVGLARIRDCQDSGTLNATQTALILGENAQRIFRLG